MTCSQEAAEIVGLKALAWLAGHDELCPIFLGATGASQDDLRERAADPEFLASVLEFLTMDDAWVVAFCDTQGLEYTEPMLARTALPGGNQVHWT